jgi:hypothetical protein
MFISSYSTYIDTSKTTRLKKDRDEKDKPFSANFSKELSKSIITPRTVKSFPIDYISNYQTFRNQQKLNYNFKNQDLAKFVKTSKQLNAQTSYKQNSRMFSLVLKPLGTLNQTHKINTILPNNFQELKKQFARKDMISTYTSNVSYFNITAA